VILSESRGQRIGLCYTLNNNQEKQMSQIYKLPLVLEPQPEGGYVVTCPLLPELITEGETVQDALQNANDALAAIVEALKDLKKPLPSVLQATKENTPLWVETVLAI
jgi:antitoxin HicB